MITRALLRGSVAFALAAGLSALGSTGVHAQDPLPDAPGKEQVVAVCSKCHEPQRVAALRLTREGWEEVVAKMQTLGAKGSEEDFKKITDYLSENFKGEAPKPINMNTASAVELESVYENLGGQLGFRTEASDLSVWFVVGALLVGLLVTAGTLVWSGRVP